MFAIYNLTRLAPMKVGITGKKRNLLLRLFENVFPLKKGIVEITDHITIDVSKSNEKMLFYFFHNIVRYYQGTPLFKYIEKNLSADDIFLDIGANLGFYSSLAKKRVGCQVYLFEPEPNHFEFIRRNDHLFDRLFDIALSTEEGESEFYVGSDTNLGASSLVPSDKGWENSGYSHSVKVKTQRLDTLITDTETINRIKLAKIDVEGAEKFVIEGMQGLLERNRIDIWCEVRGEASDRNPGSYKEVCNILMPLGYQPYLYDGNTLHKFSKEDVSQVFDLLFIHKSGSNVALDEVNQ